MSSAEAEDQTVEASDGNGHEQSCGLALMTLARSHVEGLRSLYDRQCTGLLDPLWNLHRASDNEATVI